MERVRADVAVVGSGLAGLVAALAAAPLEVVVLTRGRAGESGSSPRALGGVAAALGPGDDPLAHARDTLEAACGLGDPEAAVVVTEEGPERIRWLVELGARFDRNPDGSLALGREGAHRRARIVHAGGDATGEELVRVVLGAVRRQRRIRVLPGLLAVDLLTAGSRVAGVAAVDRRGRRVAVVAPRVILATGGCGHLWSRTTNPPDVSGGGLALAAGLGLDLLDMEMVQFHPTALAAGGDPLPVLTEALRGEGAVLRDGAGRAFMAGEHPLGDLAPRDVVARAIQRRLAAGGVVTLDATPLGRRLLDRFPAAVAAARARGIDPLVEPMPVTPAAHYLMGGVPTDLQGRTAADGLWACGEVACTGVHGANRLASNSLLEALVFGWRTGRSAAATPAPAASPATARWPAGPPWLEDAPPTVREGLEEVREAMWRWAGLTRTGPGLERLLDRIELAAARVGIRPSEAVARLEVSRAVALAALERDASLGAHHRLDGCGGTGAGYRVAVREGRARRIPGPAPAPAVVGGA